MSKTRIALTIVIAVALLGTARIVPLAQSLSHPVALKSRVLRAAINSDEALQPLTQLARGERKRVIVQLDALPDSEARAGLEADGIKLLQYIGSNAFYASVSGGVDASALRR